MKAYSQFLKELPSKKIVFAFGRFQPPTIGHELLVKAVEKIAKQQGAAHIIYASHTQDKSKNPLSVDRKVYYLKRMFPEANFKAAGGTTRTFIEVAKELNKRYKNLVMVAGSDRVPEYKKLLEKYNGTEFNFDTISVVSAGERDPDSDTASGMSGTKMREAAKKGDFDSFKKGLPHTLTTVDGKRLMNEIREGMGMDAIKEQVKFARDWLRESYYRGEIYKIGQFVESNGERFEILDRGSNYVTVVDSNGSTHRKWITDITICEDYVPADPSDIIDDKSDLQITYKGYRTKHFDVMPDASVAFAELIAKDDVDAVAILNAIKATDEYLKLLQIISNTDEIDDQQHHDFDTYVQKAQEYLMNAKDLQHHADYINSAIHKVNQVTAQYHMEKDEQMEESMKTFKELMEMKFNATDKIKVARIIADALGVPDVEKTTNAEILINNALRKVRNKPLRAENIAIIKNMLQTAKEAGINYDEKLVPQKVDEQAPVAPAPKVHRIAVTVSEPDHPAVSKRKETQQKFVRVTHNDNKEEAIARGKKHFAKKGYKVHGAEHVGMVHEEVDLDESMVDSWKKVQSMDKGSVTGGKEQAKKRLAYLTAVHAHHKKYGNDTKKVKSEIESLNRSRIAEDSNLDESHVEFRIDHRQKVAPGHEKTFKDHEAKVSEVSDKATYVKVPSHKANSFKSAMKTKHGIHLELAEETELDESTPYWKKSSWIKKMSQAAKQERLAREKKEAEQKKQVKENIDEACSCEDEENKVKVGDTGKLTYDAMKNFLGIQNVHSLKPNELKSVGVPVSPNPLRVKHQRMHEETEEDFEELDDSEFDDDVNSISEVEHVIDAYDDEELAIIDDETGEEIEVEEPEEDDEDENEKENEKEEMKEAIYVNGKIVILEISRMERIRRKQRFARTKSKREMRAKIALRRSSNTATIAKRSRRLATSMIKKRLLRKDPNKATLAEKERVEAFLKKRKALVDRLARRVAPRLRQVEKARLQHKRFTK